MKAPLRVSKGMIWLLLLAFILFVITLFASANWIQEWLWMKQVGYGAVFWRILSIKLLSAAAAILVAFGYLWFNLRLAVNAIFRLRANADEANVVIYLDQGVAVSSRWARAGTILVAAVIGLFFGSMLYSQWDTYLRFHWAGAFGQIDPIFEKDIGFYLFRLPFYELVRGALMGLTFVTLAAVATAYGYFKVFQPRQLQTTPTDRTVVGHLALLLLFFVASWGWGYYLDRFGLLYSTRGVVYGVGYTADHIERIGLWVMVSAAVIFGIFLVLCFLKRRLYPMLIGAGRQIFPFAVDPGSNILPCLSSIQVSQ